MQESQYGGKCLGMICSFQMGQLVWGEHSVTPAVRKVTILMLKIHIYYYLLSIYTDVFCFKWPYVFRHPDTMIS